MKVFQKIKGYSIGILLLSFVIGCNRAEISPDGSVDAQERVLWFDLSLTEENAPGKNYPLAPQVKSGDEVQAYQVNLNGASFATGQTFNYRVVAEETTAQEGVHYELEDNGEYTIPGRQKTANVLVRILDFTGDKTVMLVLELIDSDGVQVNPEKGRIAIPILEEPDFDLEAIQIIVDKTDPYVDNTITFSIAGEANSFDFFSGEPGNIYDENNPQEGTRLEGNLTSHTYSFDQEGVYNAVFVAYNKEGNKKVFGPYAITVTVDPDPNGNNPILTAGSMIVSFQNNSPDGLVPWVDLASISAHDRDFVRANSANIDFGVAWNVGSGNVPMYIVPALGHANTSYVKDQNGGWATRNSGIFVRIWNPSPDEMAAFDNLERRNDLVAAFDYWEANIKSRPGYTSHTSQFLPPEARNGPYVHIEQIGHAAGVEEIFYFKSTTRNLYAAFKVKVNPPSGSPGQNATLELTEVKSVLKP